MPTQDSVERAGVASMTELLSCRCELEAGWREVRLRRLFGLTVPDRRRSGSVAVWEHLDTIDLPPAASRILLPYVLIYCCLETYRTQRARSQSSFVLLCSLWPKPLSTVPES